MFASKAMRKLTYALGEIILCTATIAGAAIYIGGIASLCSTSGRALVYLAQIETDASSCSGSVACFYATGDLWIHIPWAAIAVLLRLIIHQTRPIHL